MCAAPGRSVLGCSVPARDGSGPSCQGSDHAGPQAYAGRCARCELGRHQEHGYSKEVLNVPVAVIVKVQQQGTDLLLDMETGGPLRIDTAEATSSVMLRKKGGDLEYAD